MNNCPDTPFKTFYKGIKEYHLQKDDQYLTFLLRKTKDNIFINSDYYEISLNKNDITNLTRIIFENIDEVLIFLQNLFNQNCVQIKNITSDAIALELIINNSQNQRVNLCLTENLDNHYYLFKDLYQKQKNLQKELMFLKEDNCKLRKENMNMKNDIISLKNDFISEMEQINMKILNLMNQINLINQKNISIDEKIEKNMEKLKREQQYITDQNKFNMKNNQEAFKMMQNQMIMHNQKIEKLEFQAKDKGKSISVLFKNPMGFIIPVICYQTDLCSEMIKKYKNKDASFRNDDNLLFYFNGQNLKENLSLFEYGIYNGCQIFVIN